MRDGGVRAGGPPQERPHWALAAFSSRESPDALFDSMQAVIASERAGASLAVDVLVNGNAALAHAMSERLRSAAIPRPEVSVRLWHLPLPDKADAWNRYVHALMPRADIAFFMDGYVRLERTALARMADALARRPEALAATCVPWKGRTAATLRRRFLEEGGFHGNLYAFPSATVGRLREHGVRLPLGIYRNDSALGAALAFGLDPASHPFRWDRIVVVPDARYDAPVANPLRFGDLKTVLKRRARQAQGQLETSALRAHLALAHRSPAAWPRTARELILQWAAEHRGEARALLWRDPLAWATLRRLAHRADAAAPAAALACLGRFPDVRAAGSPRPRISET